MGDVGSQFCGFMLAVLGVAASRFQGVEMSFLLMPMLLSGVLFDVAFTLMRRALAGERLTQPHRGHIFQLAHRAGMSAVAITFLYWGFTIWGGIVSLLFLSAAPVWKLLMPMLLIPPQLAWVCYVMHRSGSGRFSTAFERITH
jgi:UDP-GlcNAc:undecaprenyl-phosphate GlcNAc-1-phosphate transferase